MQLHQPQRQQQQEFAGAQQPLWAHDTAAGLIPQSRKTLCVALLVLTAALLGQPAAAWMDHVLDLGAGVYNPSLVVYQGTAWSVARSTQLKYDTTGLKWIVNSAHLCRLNTTDWTTISCHAFDPWRGRYGVQCRWGSDEWKVPWEAWGVDDTKLFVWPGRGLWAITGRRPNRAADSQYCPQVVWRQWLVQLAGEGQKLDPAAFNYPSNDVIPGVAWAPSSQAGKPQPISTAVSATRHVFSFFGRRGKPPSPAVPVLVMESHAATSKQLLQTDDGLITADSISSNSSSSSIVDQQQLKQRRAYGRRGRRIRRRRRRHARPEHKRPSAQQAARPVAASPAASPTGAAKPPGLLLPPPPQPVAAQQQTAVNSTISTTIAALPTLPSSASSSVWSMRLGAPPVPLHITDAAAVYGKGYAISEKNWMPFIHQGDLLVSYSLAPQHRVYQLNPNGDAEFRYATDTGDVFQHLGPAAKEGMHGGPPMVRVVDPASAGVSSSPADKVPAAAAGVGAVGGYYLGVAHFWEVSPDSLTHGNKDGRVYRHYFIKVEPQPPFKVLQVSKELPLKYNEHYKKVAFVSGLDLVLLPAAAAAAATAAASSTPAASRQGKMQSGQHRVVAPTHRRTLASERHQLQHNAHVAPAEHKSVHPQPSSPDQRKALHQQQQQEQRQQFQLGMAQLLHGAAQALARRLLAAGPAAPATGGSSKAADTAATSTAAPAAGVDTGSTGSLAADAEADEFSWSVQQRPADVNAFSWVAKPDYGGGAHDPAAKGQQGATAAGGAQTFPTSKAAAAAAAAGGSSSPAAPRQQQVAEVSAFGDNDDPGSSEFSWDVRPDPPDVNLFSWDVPSKAAPAAAGAVVGQDSAGGAGAGGAVGLIPLPADPEASAAAAAGAAAGVAVSGVQQGLVQHVVLSYGSGDWESHVAVLTLQQVEQLFL